MRQLPDWLRKALGLEPRFRRGHSRHMPFPVELALNDVLERMVAGPSRNFQTAGTVKMKNILEAVHSLQTTWSELCKDHDATADFMSKEELVNSKWVQRFLQRWGWSLQASNTKGAYLADDSEVMHETGIQKQLHT